MSKDYKLQFRAFFKLLAVCVFALLYALGGVEHKWMRRFIAPLWLAGAMYYFSRNWRVFLYLPLQVAALHLGYGADEAWQKFFRRLLYGAANGFTNLAFWRKGENYPIMLMGSVVTLTLVVVWLGVFNPFETRTEELLIGLFIGIWPMYTAKENKNDAT